MVIKKKAIWQSHEALREFSSPSVSTGDEEIDAATPQVVFEDVYETLLAKILHPHPSRCVVSIYGMGGLGKTTLAKRIYDSAKVVRSFDFRAWFWAPSTSNVQDLFISILKSFQREANEKDQVTLEEIKNSKGDMAGHIQNFLKHRRYLVVMDQVWEVDVWESLKRAFEENNNGSRLIITTRSKAVATQDKNFTHHELRFWTLEESWNLFCKKIWEQGENVCSPSTEILAKEMLKKCSGLQLAVNVLAELLSENKGLDAWCKVKEHIWQQLKLQSQEIVWLFSLSYSHLVKKLQDCFLYMAMFPEGFRFDVEKLRNLWIAEGFASDKDEAEEFVQKLINCSLIQVSGTLWETVVRCRLHDLVRDLAIDKAKEVGFFDIFDPFKYHSVSLSQRRNAIHGPLLNYISVPHPETDVLTLLFFKHYREYFTEIKQLFAKCMNYKGLKVLDLVGINLQGSKKELHEMLANLLDLTFLGLANTSIREIPSTIGMLTKLQILEAGGKYTCKLPEEMSMLRELRHLIGRFEGPLPTKGLDKLHTLKIVDMDQMHLLESYKNIQELAVYNRNNGSTLHFVNSARLDTLIIISSHIPLPLLEPLSESVCLKRLWLHGALKKTPIQQDFPSSLTSLILSNSKLKDDPMNALEKLPCLNNLELKNSYIGKKIVCHQNGFPQLEVLRLSELYELKEWVVEERAMPKIRGIGIFECYNLRKPDNLKSIPEVPESEVDYYSQKMING